VKVVPGTILLRPIASIERAAALIVIAFRSLARAHLSVALSRPSLPLGLDRSHSIMTTTRAVLLMAVIVAAIASVSLASFPSELLDSYVYHDHDHGTMMMMILTATSIYLMTIVTGMLEKILARRARIS